MDKKKNSTGEQFENLIDNYEGAQGYIRKNKEGLSDEQLYNMEKRQANRRVQMQNIIKNASDGEDL